MSDGFYPLQRFFAVLCGQREIGDNHVRSGALDVLNRRFPRLHGLEFHRTVELVPNGLIEPRNHLGVQEVIFEIENFAELFHVASNQKSRAGL